MLTALLFHKVLRLPISEINSASPGKLINLASGDMATLEVKARYLPFLIATPLYSIFLLLCLYLVVSLSSIRSAKLPFSAS